MTGTDDSESEQEGAGLDELQPPTSALRPAAEVKGAAGDVDSGSEGTDKDSPDVGELNELQAPSSALRPAAEQITEKGRGGDGDE